LLVRTQQAGFERSKRVCMIYFSCRRSEPISHHASTAAQKSEQSGK